MNARDARAVRRAAWAVAAGVALAAALAVLEWWRRAGWLCGALRALAALDGERGPP